MLLRFLVPGIILLSHLAVAGQNLFHGRVMDAKTGELLPFAHIYLKSMAKGTAADAEGKFIFRFTASPADTVVISYIGYNTMAMPVSKVDSNADKVVKLEPAAVSLNTVTVVGITPKELLKEALDNWDNNYFTTPTMQAGELKDYSMMDGEYLRFIDARLELYRSTFNKAYRKKRQAKHDIMMKITGGEVSSVDKAFDPAWSILTRFNMQINPYYFCEGFYRIADSLGSYMRITGIAEIEGHEAYRIYIDGRKSHRPEVLSDFAIYLDKATKAVIAIRVSGKHEPVEFKVFRSRDSTITRHFRDIICDFSYRPFNNKWIVAGIYIKGNDNYTVSYSGKKPSIELSVDSWIQFICNETKFEGVEMPRSSECADQEEDIYKQIPTKSSTLIEHEGKPGSRLDELGQMEQKEFGK